MCLKLNWLSICRARTKAFRITVAPWILRIEWVSITHEKHLKWGGWEEYFYFLPFRDCANLKCLWWTKYSTLCCWSLASNTSIKLPGLFVCQLKSIWGQYCYLWKVFQIILVVETKKLACVLISYHHQSFQNKMARCFSFRVSCWENLRTGKLGVTSNGH